MLNEGDKALFDDIKNNYFINNDNKDKFINDILDNTEVIYNYEGNELNDEKKYELIQYLFTEEKEEKKEKEDIELQEAIKESLTKPLLFIDENNSLHVGGEENNCMIIASLATVCAYKKTNYINKAEETSLNQKLNKDNQNIELENKQNILTSLKKYCEKEIESESNELNKNSNSEKEIRNELSELSKNSNSENKIQALLKLDDCINELNTQEYNNIKLLKSGLEPDESVDKKSAFKQLVDAIRGIFDIDPKNKNQMLWQEVIVELKAMFDTDIIIDDGQEDKQIVEELNNPNEAERNVINKNEKESGIIIQERDNDNININNVCDKFDRSYDDKVKISYKNNHYSLNEAVQKEILSFNLNSIKMDDIYLYVDKNLNDINQLQLLDNQNQR